MMRLLESRDIAAAPKRAATPSPYAQKVSALCVTQALQRKPMHRPLSTQPAAWISAAYKNTASPVTTLPTNRNAHLWT
jgi:hypothetical protein